MSKFLREIFVIWYRDLLRFWRNKTRVLTGFSFPVLWLLIFGNGISASLSLPVPGITFIQFLFPGVISQYLIFTSMFSAISILQDREFGFLKEVLVSPVSRTSIALGKVFGGATTAMLQASPILILGPVVGVPVSFPLLLSLIPAMFMLAVALSAMGVAITSRMKSLDSGQYLFQFITFPIVMLSGAFFPLRNLPAWLDLLVRINPISYAVDILRRLVLSNLGLPNAIIQSLSPTVGGEVIPLHWEIGLVLAFALILVLLSSKAFDRT